MTGILLGLMLLIGAGTGHVGSAAADEPRSLTQGALRFESLSHDFGKARQNQELEGTVRFRNMSDGPVTDLAIVADCGCYGATVSATRVEAGDQGTILIRFRTLSFSGVVDSKKMTIRWKDDQPRSVKVALRVEVTQGILLDPGRMHFRPTLVGNAPEGEMLAKYHRKDGRPFRITGVERPDPNIVVAEPEAWSEGDWQGWRLRFRFANPPPRGLTNTAVFLKTNHPDHPRMRVSVGVMVHGKVWLQKERVLLGLVPQGSARQATVLFRGFDGTIDLGKVRASSRRGKVSVSVREATHLPRPQAGNPTLYEVVIRLPANAPEGPIRDTVDIHTDVPGYERVAIPVTGRIYVRR